jgi:cytidine deaminase
MVKLCGWKFDIPDLADRPELRHCVVAVAPHTSIADFFVGAAVLMDSGKIYTGSNVENASFPAGCCAERTAIYHAVACGERKIRAIAIVGGRKGENRTYAAPCGVCRQVMREFCNPKEMTVILAKTPEDYREMKLEDLLPMSFGPEHLPGFGGEA